MNIKELCDLVDARPGLSHYEYTLRRYAMDLLENHILNNGLNIWDDMENLSQITEADLLDGSGNWFEYSRHGNALIWLQDISMRLFGKKTYEGNPEDLVLCQALMLSRAAAYLISCINMFDTQKSCGDVCLKFIELSGHSITESCPAIVVFQADN